MAELKLELDDSINEVIDEAPGSNSFIALRKLRWREGAPFKVDLRKWFVNGDGEEIAGKGVSFMTEEGPDNLVKALLKNGYGDTLMTMEAMKDREDFLPCLKEVITSNNIDLDSVEVASIDSVDAEYFDPKSIL